MGTTAGPLTPPAYVSGSVTIAGNAAAVTLLSLIQASLEPVCPGAVAQFMLYADAGNDPANTIKIGCPVRGGASGTPGPQPLDNTHFGYELGPRASRTYGPLILSSTPLASIYVFCAANVTLHVEVFP